MTAQEQIEFYRDQQAITRRVYHGPDTWDALLADADDGLSHE